MRFGSAFVIAISLTSSLTSGAAPTKGECVDANTQGQLLRKDEKFHAARNALQTCIDPKCPSVVRADCQTRLDEIAHAMPSVVLQSTDPSAAAGTTVTMDGATVTSALGETIEVDPGEHHFIFRSGTHTATRVVTLDENEKARHVEFAFEETRIAPAATGNATFRIAGIALVAVGIVGIGVGSGFGIASFSAWGSVKSECAVASTCDYAKATSDRSTALGFATASDIAFPVGAAFAVAGAILFGLGARVAPVAGPRVIGLVLSEPF